MLLYLDAAFFGAMSAGGVVEEAGLRKSLINFLRNSALEARRPLATIPGSFVISQCNLRICGIPIVFSKPSVCHRLAETANSLRLIVAAQRNPAGVARSQRVSTAVAARLWHARLWYKRSAGPLEHSWIFARAGKNTCVASGSCEGIEE